MPLACLLTAAIITTHTLSQDHATPAVLTQIDGGKVKGAPAELAWSEDGSQLYVQTAERDSDGRVKRTHSFVLTLDNPALRSVDGAPDWATPYWNWKSYNKPPNSEAPEIQVSKQMRTRIATESAMGGSTNEGGGNIQNMGGLSGTSIESVATRAQQQAKVEAIVLTLKDEVVGEFVGTPARPGYTFGWAPAMPARLAYANTLGHLAVIDAHGQKQEIAGTKNVILPAWSPDGSKIAFVSTTGKNKYDLCVVDAPASR